jgi:hypothetical protein
VGGLRLCAVVGLWRVFSRCASRVVEALEQYRGGCGSIKFLFAIMFSRECEAWTLASLRRRQGSYHCSFPMRPNRVPISPAPITYRDAACWSAVPVLELIVLSTLLSFFFLSPLLSSLETLSVKVPEYLELCLLQVAFAIPRYRSPIHPTHLLSAYSGACDRIALQCIQLLRIIFVGCHA